MSDSLAEIGVIGGSGFYSWIEAGREVPVDTPFGKPSDPPVVGEVAGRRVAFLPRHGTDHRFPPHRVNTGRTCGVAVLGVRQASGPAAGIDALNSVWASPIPDQGSTGPGAGAHRVR
jgi:5'-methylthioadenosine phosphorylase